jgi:hypothetical protein
MQNFQVAWTANLPASFWRKFDGFKFEFSDLNSGLNFAAAL